MEQCRRLHRRRVDHRPRSKGVHLRVHSSQVRPVSHLDHVSDFTFTDASPLPLGSPECVKQPWRERAAWIESEVQKCFEHLMSRFYQPVDSSWSPATALLTLSRQDHVTETAAVEMQPSSYECDEPKVRDNEAAKGKKEKKKKNASGGRRKKSGQKARKAKWHGPPFLKRAKAWSAEERKLFTILCAEHWVKHIDEVLAAGKIVSRRNTKSAVQIFREVLRDPRVTSKGSTAR